MYVTSNEESAAYMDDDYYLEEEGFDGYVATAVDPGPWVMIVTVIISLLSVVAVPILVILGERYERRRRQREALAQQKLEEEAERQQQDIVVNKTKQSYTINVTVNGVPLEDAVEAERRSGRFFVPYVHDITPNSSKVELARPSSTLTSTSHPKAKPKAMTQAFMDMLLIPKYPDDDMEVKTKISFAQGLASPESAPDPKGRRLASVVLSDDYGSSLMGGTRSTTFLDAGAAASGRRHRRGMRNKPGAHQYIIQKYTQEEEEWEERHSAIAGDGNANIPTPLQRYLASTKISRQRGTTASRQNESKSSAASANQSNMSLTTWERHAQSTVVDDISPNDAADANDPGKDYLEKYIDNQNQLDICCGPNALWKWSTLVRALDALIDISDYDNEMKRIIRLAIPFVTEEVMETVFDTIDLALVANFVGTDAASAYVVADTFISMTDEFIAGIGDAQGTLCPHALGAGNNTLAGQYVQIGILVFFIASVPILTVWCFFIDRAILWFGLSPHVARIGLEWTRIAAINYLVAGVSESVVGLLEISDHEAWVAIVDIVFGLLDAAATALTVTTWKVTLSTVAWIHLASDVLFFIFVVVAASSKGWYRQFYKGLIGSCAFKNIPAVKRLVMAAIPLSFGSLLAYSEWEVITFLASRLGPAEAVAWSFLGTVWETFEATTEGLGEAAAVRISLHLGKGRPDLAQLSTSKCLLISVLLSFFITSILFMCGDNIAIWLSKDVTLQNMLADLLPLVGLGNITLTFGMTAWHIIGAQGRYRLAMVIAMVCSWGITVPLAALSVKVMNLDLKALVGTVIIGYSITGAVMAFVLLRSDWARISQIIRDINRLTGETYSDDSEHEAERSEASESFVPKSTGSSSLNPSDEDNDSAPSKINEKARVSHKSITSSAVSSDSHSRRLQTKVVSKTASNSLLAASASRRNHSYSKGGHVI